MANVVKGADISDAELTAIAAQCALANDDGLKILAALPGINQRFASICAPLIMQHIANVVKGVDVPDAKLTAIATLFANDEGFEILTTLTNITPRFASICAPLVAQHIAKSEARVQTVIEQECEFREYRDEKGRLHRYNDRPAVIGVNDDTRVWYWHGQLHRGGDKPAMMDTWGQYWFRHNKHHRDGDRPAIIRSDGTMEWYQDGVRHRDGNKPAIKQLDGSRVWYQAGKMITGQYPE